MSDSFYNPQHRAAVRDEVQLAPGNEGVPTQVANPNRTTLRTIIQSIIGVLVVAVPLLNVVLAQLIDYLRTQTDVQVAPWIFLALNATLAGTALVIGLVARIMAIPGVSAFITRYIPFLAPVKVTTR